MRSQAVIALLLLAAACRGSGGDAARGEIAGVVGGRLRIDAGDGAARTAPDSAARAPSWSPSGRLLAYLTGDGVRVVRPDATPVFSHTDAEECGWAPSADRLACVAGGDLVVLDSAGNATTLVRHGATAAVAGIAWSPDGATIAYGWRPGPASAASTEPRLWTVPSAGGTPTPLAIPQDQLTGDPLVRGWTGDGRYILYLLPVGELRSASLLADGAPLFAVPARGGTPIRLAESVLPYDDFVAPEPPPGGRVAVVEGSGRAAWSHKALVLVRPGAAPRRLSPAGHAAISPAWAPDGDRLAYVDMPEVSMPAGAEAKMDLSPRRIVVTDTTGSSSHPLVSLDGRQEAPHWAADGRSIAFVRVDSLGAASVWRAAVEAGRPSELLTGLGPPLGQEEWSGYYGHVRWQDYFDWRSRGR